MPARRFTDARAFRQSLDERLNQLAETERTTVNALRLKLLMERLLARLFAGSESPWLLKGGYAMELRFHPRARTTTDLDLSFTVPARGASPHDSIDVVRERLQKAAALELGDHLVYRIGEPKLIQAAPGGGARFPVVVMLAAREYGRFHVDVGLGPVPEGHPERLIGSDFLAFAGVPPAEALSVAREVQFAEKLHAYTRPWGDRVNSRTKDLVDLLLLIETGAPPRAALVAALQQTFGATPDQPLPRDLPAPPASWESDFAQLAAGARLSTRNLTSAFERLADFWQQNRLGDGAT